MERHNRVLVLSHDAGLQGAPAVLLRLLTWLSTSSRYEFELVVHQGGPLLGQMAHCVPTHVLNPWLGSSQFMARVARRVLAPTAQDRMFAIRLRRRVRRGRYDLVWINSVATWRLLDALSPVHSPRLIYVHELDYSIGQLGLPVGRLAKLADHFAVVSEEVREALVNRFGVDEERVSVVYGSVPARSIEAYAAEERAVGREVLGVGPNDLLVVGCGVGQLHKGIDLLPRLLGGLKTNVGDRATHLLWVGRCDPATRQMVQTDATRLGVGDRLHFSGEVDDPTSIFRLADVFVLPSHEDSFPLVCLEAAQCGLPTVCFDRAGGAPEFVHGDAGRVVPFLDVGAMAAAVDELLLDSELRSRLGEQARRKVEKRFTVETQGPKLLELMERVTTGEIQGDTSNIGAVMK